MKKIYILLLLSLLIFINSQDEKKDDNSNDNNKENENKKESNDEKKNLTENIENEEQDIDIEIFPESEYIIDLTDNTINETVHNNSYVLVFFYNQYYDRCKEIIPIYIKLAKEFKEKGSDIIFGKVNGKKNFETVLLNGVSSYPALMLYVNITNYYYTDYLNEESIKKFIEKKIKNPILERNNFEEIKEEIKNRTLYFISTINPETEKEKYKNLKDIATKYDDIFDIFNCLNCKEKTQSDLTLIKIIPEEEIIKYDNSSFSNVSIDYFIRRYYRNNKEKLNHLDFVFVFRYNQTFILYLRNNDNEEDIKKDEIFKNLHLQYEGKYIITYTDIEENNQIGNYAKELFLLEKNEIPIVKIYNPENFSSYSYNGEITKEKIIDLITKYEKNELIREKNSESIQNDLESSLIYLVGKNFYQKVFNESLNYIVLFLGGENTFDDNSEFLYQNLTYLADKYKFLNETRIKFGVINLDYNEIDEVIEIKPSIGIYLNGKKDKPLFYNGTIDFNSIELWIYDCLEWDKNNIPFWEPQKEKNDNDNENDNKKVNDNKSENVDHEKSDL